MYGPPIASNNPVLPVRLELSTSPSPRQFNTICSRFTAVYPALCSRSNAVSVR